MPTTSPIVLAALAAFAAPAASASTPDCFDAIVLARIVKQVPTAYPDCGKDCIVMSWPWIVEFDVDQAVAGTAPSGRLKVLAVQHTDFRHDLGTRRWWLRRNDLGGFNLLRFGESEHLDQCTADGPPARAYLHPSAGQTLDDVEKEGEKAWNR